jgi:murein DD-endopeptidase MepM/ murein hydrolase activator NlpD
VAEEGEACASVHLSLPRTRHRRTYRYPILAASGGTIIDSGPATGFGLWVRIQHPGGVVTVYGHNNANLVQKGQQVQAGQPIAEVGDRGESTGPHLHFQIDLNNQAIDPLAFYQQQSAPP